MTGMRCQSVTAQGHMCKKRAYARIIATKNGDIIDAWKCGPHQAKLRGEGWRVTLLEKWRAPKKKSRDPEEPRLTN